MKTKIKNILFAVLRLLGNLFLAGVILSSIIIAIIFILYIVSIGILALQHLL